MTSTKPKPATVIRRAITGAGVFQHYRDGQPLPEFSVRLTFNHRRTWRKLEARTLKKAIAEVRETPFSNNPRTFEKVCRAWLAAGCPGKRRKLMELTQPRRSADWLMRYFGSFRVDEIRMRHLKPYHDWRKTFIHRGPGGRTVDLDLTTLSIILHHAVEQGWLDTNPIYRGRRRFVENSRKAREVMPQDAETIHALARQMFQIPRDAVHGWHAFFAMFTGCRTSELLRLRVDAANAEQPGFVEWLAPEHIAERKDDVVGALYLGRRSKHGTDPWAKIGPEFKEMLECFLDWRRGAAAGGQWFFPASAAGTSLGGFGAALNRATKRLGLSHITPHGFRAYYATKRRRDGARSEEIAAEMGDKTVSLINDTYAANPNGRKLFWLPKTGKPAWTHFGLCGEKTCEKAK